MLPALFAPIVLDCMGFALIAWGCMGFALMAWALRKVVQADLHVVNMTQIFLKLEIKEGYFT